MKLLLDQGLPRSAALLLRTEELDAIHVGEIGMAAATDDEILVRGRQEQRTVVTLDADFHALLALSAALSPSVIRIRIEGLRSEGVTALLQKVLEEFSEELDLGAVVTVQETRMRVRRLPLRGGRNGCAGCERRTSAGADQGRARLFLASYGFPGSIAGCSAALDHDHGRVAQAR